MPDFFQLFPPQDPDLLRIVGSFWQLDLQGENPHAWAEQISAAMQDPAASKEVLDGFTPPAKAAYQNLVSQQGRRMWPEFSREFGEIREMGAGKRDRERPQDNPENVSEYLYYRGCIGRLFLPVGDALREFVCIPDELLPGKPNGRGAFPVTPGRPAAANMHARVLPASDDLLNHCTVLLAARRSGLPLETLSDRDWASSIPFLVDLLRSSGIMDQNGFPLPNPTKAFLETPRPKAMAQLFFAWFHSKGIMDLKYLPAISLQGAWGIDPEKVRLSITGMLRSCPKNTWWDLNAFIASIRSNTPDFLREGGEYESWFVRQVADQKEWKGFASWFHVEGGLIRFLISQLNSFGMIDLGLSTENDEFTAFRLCADFDERLEGRSVFTSQPENGKISFTSTSQVLIPRTAPRVIHYQLSRYCDWSREDQRGYRFRITSASLVRAESKGLKVSQLRAILHSGGMNAIPPAVEKSLQNWETHRSQARFERPILLKVARAEMIQELLTSQAAPWLGERLNEKTVQIKPGRERQVQDELVRLGYLADSNLDV
jgi:hypothetical protein